jgi:hypothetical protein
MQSNTDTSSQNTSKPTTHTHTLTKILNAGRQTRHVHPKKSEYSAEYSNEESIQQQLWFNWVCAQFQGDEDTIIDASPMKWNWSSSLKLDPDCETLLKYELCCLWLTAMWSSPWIYVTIPKGCLKRHMVNVSSLLDEMLGYDQEQLAVVSAGNISGTRNDPNLN